MQAETASHSATVPGAASAAEADQFLTFMLDGEEYGVDILRVQEIKGWESATEIPNTPPYIRGVINLRGTIVPVIDLRRRFAMEAIEYTNTTVIIVLRIRAADGEKTMGFIVDAVSDVYNVTSEQMKPAPEFGGQVRTDYVKGLATVDGKMVILLDIDQLVSSDVVFSDTTH
ncbi:MAG: purine-binding chemotaxis protein CheW [Gammaproteobacteria bacterium]|nr:purine-binding chemotaxis protein CheW [Gammaproteobacteria bacterium]